MTCRIINYEAEANAEKLGLRLSGDRLYGEYDYDIEIYNNGTKKELKENVFNAFKDVYDEKDNGGPTASHIIDAMKYSMEPGMSINTVQRGSNEHKSQLPFSSLKEGKTCVECDNTGVSTSELYNAIICDFCGQRYNRR